jgi:hypothetical protein
MLYDPQNAPAWTYINPPLAPWRQLLLDAADLIEREGWAKGTYKRWSGEYCVLGALSQVAFGTPILEAIGRGHSHRRDFNIAIDMLRHAIPSKHIPLWNDGSNKTEVVRVMRHLAGV